MRRANAWQVADGALNRPGREAEGPVHFCVEAQAFPFDPQPGADIRQRAEAPILRPIDVGHPSRSEYRRPQILRGHRVGDSRDQHQADPQGGPDARHRFLQSRMREGATGRLTIAERCPE